MEDSERRFAVIGGHETASKLLSYMYPERFTGASGRLIIVDTSTFKPPAIEEYEEILDTKPLPNETDIPDLKKRIKYCKNPLERKNLQRELNRVYKNRKKGYE